ncbi:Protein FMP42 [Penicillium taxi]|uniref:Protein FMP42 n=1 Tax=Penicillium taxi TaxID=168475 RepID=UPI00254542A5|nr:Protein FMP42 [Penicillium taxi]KAJ5895631.1 Protein FMP42 [Penicillium taxi]
MSLNRVSFLEGWERSPGAFQRGRPDQSDTESEFQDLPESSLSSSFPSTYSRLNFNPYAGPGWNQRTDDRDDRTPLLGSFGLSPTRGRSQVDTERGPSPSLPSHSATPIPVSVPKEESGVPDTLGAFEVSRAKRIAQVSLAVVYCFLAAGVVFGFAALKPVLIRENVYRNLCTRQELETDVAVCDGQEIRLNLMFTIAAVVTNVSALPVGTILDSYGPRVSGIIGSFFLALGAILFGTASRLPFDGYIPGYLLLSLGGPFIFISSFQLSNTFPARSGLILSMLTGAFDASSALFLIFRLLSESSDGAFSVEKFFMIYLLVPVFIITVQLTVMPSTSYKTASELVQHAETQVIEEINDRVDDSINDRNEGERQRNYRRIHRQSVVHQIQDLLDDETLSVGAVDESVFDGNIPDHPNGDSLQTPPLAAPASTHISGIWGVLHGYSALSQLRTPWFILITLFTVLMMLRINYFVASIRKQYTYLLSPTKARDINTIFDILLPAGGIVSIPFIGTFLDSFKTRTVLAILVGTASVIGILGCIPHSMGAGYANIALFVLYRPFYYTAVSDYAAKVFGFQTFGKVYGLIICLAGVGNFAQAGLDALTLKAFEGNPVPVNVALTLLVGLVGSVLVGFVSYQTSVLQKEGLEAFTAEANERESLLAVPREVVSERIYGS